MAGLVVPYPVFARSSSGTPPIRRSRIFSKPDREPFSASTPARSRSTCGRTLQNRAAMAARIDRQTARIARPTAFSLATSVRRCPASGGNVEPIGTAKAITVVCRDEDRFTSSSSRHRFATTAGPSGTGSASVFVLGATRMGAGVAHLATSTGSARATTGSDSGRPALGWYPSDQARSASCHASSSAGLGSTRSHFVFARTVSLAGRRGRDPADYATSTAVIATFNSLGPTTTTSAASETTTTYAIYAYNTTDTTSRLKGSGCSGSIDKKQNFFVATNRAMPKAITYSSAFVAWPIVAVNTLIRQFPTV